MIPISNVEKKAVKFLWKPYIPLGRVTIIDGDPGCGKSWLAMKVASNVTSGAALPLQNPMEPAPVLYFSAEDDVSTVIKPRVSSMGANEGLFFARSDAVSLEDTRALVDMLDMVQQAVGISPRLIIFDPLQAYMSNMYYITRVRSVMNELYNVASERGLAIVLIRHIVKSAGRAIARGLGSIDFSAAVRSVLSVGSSILHPGIRVMVHSKSSYAQAGPSLGYRINDGRFEWVGEIDVSSGDLVGTDINSDARSALDEAKDFLLEALRYGQVPTKDVVKEARQLGISITTLKRAKRILGVNSKKVGGRYGYWVMEL